jgi:hypothetical protein
MRDIDVLPQRASFPTMETGHVEQYMQISLMPNESLEFRQQTLIIRLGQLPADVNSEHFFAVLFIYVNGHI